MQQPFDLMTISFWFQLFFLLNIVFQSLKKTKIIGTLPKSHEKMKKAGRITAYGVFVEIVMTVVVECYSP